MGGALENKDDIIKHYNKSEQKCKREQKGLERKYIITYLYKSKDTCPQKPRLTYIKGRRIKNKNSGVGGLPAITNTDTLLLGSHNTLVVLNDYMLVSLVTNHFWYGTADK